MLVWRKAQASVGLGACVEVAAGRSGWVYVRDSKQPSVAQLEFTAAEWAAFLDGARKGEFDSDRLT